MTDTLHYVALKNYIIGLPQPRDFEFASRPLPTLQDGQFIAQNHYVSVDPGMRSRLSGEAGYAPPLKLGELVNGFALGQVINSRSEHFTVGDMVVMGSGWASHSVYHSGGFAVKLPSIDIPQSHFLGVLGIPGMTAYFGLKRVAQLKAGDHVLITSAAGPVGATAGQLAKQWGAASVVGIAGSDEKCEWLVKEAGFDHAINYKKETNLAGAIALACPQGVDVLFDNVGNKMIDTVLPLMRMHGRIVVSGQTADYSEAVNDRHGIQNTAHIISRRLLMQGLVVFDDIPQFAQAQNQMSELILTGKLLVKEEIIEGFESIPQAFCGLFTGDNFGRRLVNVRNG